MILFICTGNTCRSPMAMALCRLHGVDALSAGLSAFPGDAAIPEAQRAMRVLGGDLSHHRARMVSEEMMQKAEKVFPMTQAHALMLARLFPTHAHKIQLLSPQIPDPFGGDDQMYAHCAHQLLLALKNAGVLK